MEQSILLLLSPNLLDPLWERCQRTGTWSGSHFRVFRVLPGESSPLEFVELSEDGASPVDPGVAQSSAGGQLRRRVRGRVSRELSAVPGGVGGLFRDSLRAAYVGPAAGMVGGAASGLCGPAAAAGGIRPVGDPGRRILRADPDDGAPPGSGRADPRVHGLSRRGVR